MNEVGSVGIDIFKRTNTAELRRRFESINLLLADGFNHKQICERLNSEGLDIPYPQYRAIMTRLRRENNSSNLTHDLSSHPGRITPISPPLSVSLTSSVLHREVTGGIELEKQLVWNLDSEVKWK